MRTLLILPALAALAACQTSMATRPVDPARNTALIGTPYSLPALRYDLTVTRTLSKCDATTLEFETTVTAAAAYVPGERYVIDYRKLSGWSKTTTFKLETYENQTLKGLNASAEDHGPEIAGSLIKTGFAVARMAAGLPQVEALVEKGLTEKAAKAKGFGLACPEAVGHVETLVEGLKAPTKMLKDKTKELDRLTVAQFVGTLSDADRGRVTKLRDEIDTLTEKTAAMQKQIDAWKKALSFVETVTVTPAAGRAPEVIAFPSADGTRRAEQVAWLKSMFGVEPDASTLEAISQRVGVLAATVEVRNTGQTAACDDLGVRGSCRPAHAPNWAPWGGHDTYRGYDTEKAKPLAAPGLVAREPVATRLRVCRDALEESPNAGQAPRMLMSGEALAKACREGVKALVENDAAAPQLGPTYVLPLTNGFGQNNKLVAAFRKDGSLETVGYDGTGVGTRMASLLGGAVDEAAAYQAADKARRDAAAEKAAGAEMTALEAELTLAKKKKELADAQAALDPLSAAAAQAQAELDAQVARLEAQKKIKELEAAIAGAAA